MPTNKEIALRLLISIRAVHDFMSSLENVGVNIYESTLGESMDLLIDTFIASLGADPSDRVLEDWCWETLYFWFSGTERGDGISNLTPQEMVEYLHDKISNWVREE